MSCTKISALPGASTLTGAETIPLVQGGTTKKVTTDQFLIKDASGNVGVGVTPSGNFTLQTQVNYGSGFKGFSLGGFRGGASGGGYPWVGYNIRPTSTAEAYVYDVGDAVSAIKFADGISFNVAPSGTAGNPISFTQAMTLDASGNLLVGTTSNPYVNKAVINGSLSVLGPQLNVAAGTSGVTPFEFVNRVGGGFDFYVNNGGTIGARLDASGNLLVNGSSAAERLTVGDTSSTSSGLCLRTTKTDFLIQPSATDGGGVNIAVGWVAGGQGPLKFSLNGTERARIDASGNLTPGGDNTQTLGSGALRWSTVYAGTGTINTSDAREKTEVRFMAADEIEAAKELSKEIGIYQFLDSVAKKGDKARHHVGLTVQRAIELMKLHGLDPFAYGFICFDKWDDVVVEHPAVEAKAATEAKDEVVDAEGNVIEAAVEAQAAIEAKDAWTEVTLKAGDRYSFRYDQLNLFIARGIEARLAALEAKRWTR